MRRLLLAALLALPVAAQAQTPPATPPANPPIPAPVEASEALKAKIAGLTALLNGEGDYDAYFSDGFRTAVPKAQFDQLRKQLVDTYGPAQGVISVTPRTPYAAQIRIGYRDAVANAGISVAQVAPNPVDGLRITGVELRAADIDAVLKQIIALPGKTGFALARLGPGKPRLLKAHNPDVALGVGSAFKLAILSDLIRETGKGERKWDDLVTIDGAELPAGAYTKTAKGTQVSIRELASKMISISDNSATDILLKLVGRAKVEAMLPVIGVADPARNRPYLSTLELFKLKGIPALADQYLAADEKGRRALLDNKVDTTPNSAIAPDLFQDKKPVLIDRLEWYFTPADLVRIMDWIRRNTESGPAVEARAILGINPGVSPEIAAKWQHVGYKGGSEPGVLNMTYLLQGKDGNWFVVTSSWNDTAKDVDLFSFAALMARAVELAAPQP